MHEPLIRIEHIAEFHRWMESDELSEKAKQRLRCILHYLEHKTSMAEAAAMFGMSAGALRRWLCRLRPDDPSSLEEKSCQPHTVRSTTLPADVVAHIRDYRIQVPKIGKQEIAARLLHEHGVRASASAIGRVIERECLYFADSPLHKRKRLMAQMTEERSDVDACVKGIRAIPSAHPPLAYDIPHALGQRVLHWFTSGILLMLLLFAMTAGYIAHKERVNAARQESQTNMTHAAAPLPQPSAYPSCFTTRYEP